METELRKGKAYYFFLFFGFGFFGKGCLCGVLEDKEVQKYSLCEQLSLTWKCNLQCACSSQTVSGAKSLGHGVSMCSCSLLMAVFFWPLWLLRRVQPQHQLAPIIPVLCGSRRRVMPRSNKRASSVSHGKAAPATKAKKPSPAAMCICGLCGETSEDCIGQPAEDRSGKRFFSLS